MASNARARIHASIARSGRTRLRNAVRETCGAYGAYGSGPCVLDPEHRSRWHRQGDGKGWDGVEVRES